MKTYVDVKHISNADSEDFEKEIKKTVSSFQNESYTVEIQHGFTGNVFTAIVSAYVIKQKGDIIPNHLED